MSKEIINTILKERIFDRKNKKIISFCLFGDYDEFGLPKVENKTQNSRNYTNGIFINYVLAKKYYPDWICRFYIDSSVDIKLVDRLEKIDVEYVYLKTNMNKMCLRFLVFDDPNVNIWISRDLDSILNIREKDAVYEWINRDENIHIMHDCCHHKGFKVLGGMFGAKNCFKESIVNFYDTYMKNKVASSKGSHKYGFDCEIINKYIEKHYKNDYIQHYSDGYKLENSIPFKVKSELSKFVGFQFLLNKGDCNRICKIENVDNLTSIK